jgi:hypothetical protein
LAPGLVKLELFLANWLEKGPFLWRFWNTRSHPSWFRGEAACLKSQLAEGWGWLVIFGSTEPSYWRLCLGVSKWIAARGECSVAWNHDILMEMGALHKMSLSPFSVGNL